MTHVLVPVAILERESVSQGLTELLAPATVTVLGYHELPEQTPPDQARAQFEDRAMAALDDICGTFEAAGGTAYHRLVFTHDSEKTIDRVAAEIEADAHVIPGAMGELDELLVAVSGSMRVEPILELVTTLVADREIAVTLLWHTTKDAPDLTFQEAADRLEAAGVDVTARTETDGFLDAISEAVPGTDAVIIGERAPSISALLFGDEMERVAAASVGPVLVVRAPADSAGGETTSPADEDTR